MGGIGEGFETVNGDLFEPHVGGEYISNQARAVIGRAVIGKAVISKAVISETVCGGTVRSEKYAVSGRQWGVIGKAVCGG